MRTIIFWKNLSISALVMLIVFSPTVAAQKQKVSGSGMDAERLASISVKMKSFVAERVMAGAVTLIARRGKVVGLEAVGYQDLEK